MYDHEEGPAADAAKVQGTARMLKLTRDAGNVEALAQDPALLGALSRVLAEDAPRGCGPALLYNVLRLLLVFSNFYEACLLILQAIHQSHASLLSHVSTCTTNRCTSCWRSTASAR